MAALVRHVKMPLVVVGSVFCAEIIVYFFPVLARALVAQIEELFICESKGYAISHPLFVYLVQFCFGPDLLEELVSKRAFRDTYRFVWVRPMCHSQRKSVAYDTYVFRYRNPFHCVYF